MSFHSIDDYKRVARNLRIGQLIELLELVGESSKGKRPDLLKRVTRLIERDFSLCLKGKLDFYAQNSCSLSAAKSTTEMRTTRSMANAPAATTASTATTATSSGNTLSQQQQSNVRVSEYTNSVRSQNYNFSLYPPYAGQNQTSGSSASQSQTQNPQSMATSSSRIQTTQNIHTATSGSSSTSSTVASTGNNTSTNGTANSSTIFFKSLPFYDVISELVKPQVLYTKSAIKSQEQMITFSLSNDLVSQVLEGRIAKQANARPEYTRQVQLRFCRVNSAVCDQDDCFPPNIAVKVNTRMAPLPLPIPTNKAGVEPKRPPRPVDITSLVKLQANVANSMSIAWNCDYPNFYAFTVAVVLKLNSNDLFARLKNKGFSLKESTNAIIKDKLRADFEDEIATESFRVSLQCPLGKMRITTPCRASNCKHIQCFDAMLFLQMNEKKPSWICPVCNSPILYSNLFIDGYFVDVLTSKSLTSEITEIEVTESHWKPVMKVSKPKSDSSSSNRSLTILNSSNHSNKDSNKSIDIIEIISDKSTTLSSQTSTSNAQHRPNQATNTNATNTSPTATAMAMAAPVGGSESTTTSTICAPTYTSTPICKIPQLSNTVQNPMQQNLDTFMENAAAVAAAQSAVRLNIPTAAPGVAPTSLHLGQSSLVSSTTPSGSVVPGKIPTLNTTAAVASISNTYTYNRMSGPGTAGAAVSLSSSSLSSNNGTNLLRNGGNGSGGMTSSNWPGVDSALASGIATGADDATAVPSSNKRKNCSIVDLVSDSDEDDCPNNGTNEDVIDGSSNFNRSKTNNRDQFAPKPKRKTPLASLVSQRFIKDFPPHSLQQQQFPQQPHSYLYPQPNQQPQNQMYSSIGSGHGGNTGSHLYGKKSPPLVITVDSSPSPPNSPPPPPAQVPLASSSSSSSSSSTSSSTSLSSAAAAAAAAAAAVAMSTNASSSRVHSIPNCYDVINNNKQYFSPPDYRATIQKPPQYYQ